MTERKTGSEIDNLIKATNLLENLGDFRMASPKMLERLGKVNSYEVLRLMDICIKKGWAYQEKDLRPCVVTGEMVCHYVYIGSRLNLGKLNATSSINITDLHWTERGMKYSEGSTGFQITAVGPPRIRNCMDIDRFIEELIALKATLVVDVFKETHRQKM